MKLRQYLIQLEETDKFDIEGLIKLSQAAEADKAGLSWDSRSNLSELISEKLQEGIRAGRVTASKTSKSGEK